MNLRSLLDFQEGYYRINREERNLAAILYHLLLFDNNLKKFLVQINSTFPIKEKETGIYFEYAFIRDLWNKIGNDNDLKRKVILDFLKPTNRTELEKLSCYDFNMYFGATRTLSVKQIASPSNWSIRHFDKYFPDKDEFLKVCRFKWCFNAKPDIVIHTSCDTAICIETKFESKEGKYPSNQIEKIIFKRRGLPLIGQLSVQKQLMEEILGVHTQYVFLVEKKPNPTTPEIWSWSEVFANLDTTHCLAFIKVWLKLPRFT
jgi:hypothetical protein